MNNFGLFLAAALMCSLSSVDAATCTKDASSYFDGINFVDMRDKCTSATEKQINYTIAASLKYLSMAAYFSRDYVNRPGFAKFFFSAASKEREHARKLIENLSMRGRYMRKTDGYSARSNIPNFDISSLIKNSEEMTVLGVTLTNLTATPKTTGGMIALQNALKLGAAVTKSIRDLIKVCESEREFNDYNFVEYLTSECLEEQYKSQSDLAGKISTLGKMVQGEGSELADFLFDKQLL